MKFEKAELMHYTKGEEILNVLTHLAGLVIPVLILTRCLPLCKGNAFAATSAVLYALGTAMTFISSAVYHGLKEGNAKRVFRVIDHTAIFFAVAGTVTGCTPEVFRQGFVISAVLMLIVAWVGVIAGLILTVFFFEKYKTLRMGLYIGSSALTALLGARTYFYLPIGAFLCQIFGSSTLLTGCLFLMKGKKIPYLHTVFHVLVVIGLGIYYYGIYNYVFLLI